MKKPIVKTGGASYGKRTNTQRREEAKTLIEIRCYSPAPEVINYINEESDRKMESKSLVANTLLNEAVAARKSKRK